MNKPVIIIGAGGHAKVLIEILELLSIKVIGATEKNKENFQLNIPFIGQDEVIFSYSPKEIDLVNGIGSIGNNIRSLIYDKFANKGFEFLTLVHPSAIVARDVVLKKGAQVMAGAIIQPGTSIEANTIINTKVSIDHDCYIGKHVHIAPGATLSGNVRINRDSHIGTGATIIQNVVIGQGSFVGAGSVVISNTSDYSKVVGVPAKVIN